MKKKLFRYMAIAFMLILCFTMVAGCKKKAETDQNVPTNEALPTDTPGAEDDNEQTDPGPEPEATEVPDGGTEDLDGSQDQQVETEKLPIYSINDESQECEAAVALIPKGTDITASVIVDAVVSSFADHGLDVGIEGITEDGDKVIVSFYSDKAPLFNVGSGVEAAILDSISQSLLDNLDSCKSVIFRVEGKAYESGHFAYDIDEPYSWK